MWLTLSQSPGEDRALALAAARDAAAHTDHAELHARIALAEARHALDDGRAGDARAHIDVAATRLGDVQAHGTRHQLGLLRARLALEQGDRAAAREAVRCAGRSGRGFGAERVPLMTELVREALAGETWTLAEIERAPRAALTHLAPRRSRRAAALRSQLLDCAARPLDVCALGTTEVRLRARTADPETRVSFRTPRVLDLLLFLLVEGGERPVPTDVLVDAFWGRARGHDGSLRTHLTNLRRAIEPHAVPRSLSRYLLRTADGYRVDLRGGCFDVACFRSELAAARAELRRGDADRADAAFDRALAWYRGPFAAQRPYVDALAVERRRLAHAFEHACLESARLARERRAFALARERLESLLAEDPSCDEAYALLAAWARADGRSAEVALLDARRQTARADLEVPE